MPGENDFFSDLRKAAKKAPPPPVRTCVKWSCKCGTSNWAHRQECASCGTKKPVDG